MSAPWPAVKLGEVLGLCDTAVPSSQLTEVNLAGVYSFGRGLFKRGPMSPSETSYRYYNRLVTDDYVVSQPKAWEGALARVSSDFDGWYLSPVFPTFRAIRDRLEPTYLEWFCKRRAVWDELLQKSHGMGARRESVSSEQVLSLEIPLPPPAEQRLIVARIEELAAKITEACRLRQEVIKEAEIMRAAIETRVWAGSLESQAAPLEMVTSYLARGKQSEQGDSEHFLIKSQHVQQGRLIPTSLRLAPHVATKVKQDAIVQNGDILIACSAAGYRVLSRQHFKTIYEMIQGHKKKHPTIFDDLVQAVKEEFGESNIRSDRYGPKSEINDFCVRVSDEENGSSLQESSVIANIPPIEIGLIFAERGISNRAERWVSAKIKSMLQ